MKVVNRKAKYNYYLLDTLEAGVVLTGAETKSAKQGKISLNEAYVRIMDQGVELINAHIAPYKYADQKNYDPQRTRRLLLHKKEILRLYKKMEGKNLTLVPTAAYTKNGRVKIEIALAKGKKKWDKREVIKRRDLDRQARKELRGRK